MRWFCLSLLLVVLSLGLVVSASRPSAAQNKQLSTFEMSMLASHNNVRQKSNVPPLAWDDGLAATAQDWANKIAASDAMPPPHRASGENLFWGTAGQWQPTDVLGVWEAENANFTAQSCTCAPGKSCVHYTQVVWSTTTRVGCAKARSADGQTDFFVCDYSPEGNTVGQCPFKTYLPSSARLGIDNDNITISSSVYNDNLPPGKGSSPQPTPAPTPRPVAQQMTSAPTPTSASTPNTNGECDVCKNVQQLTAEVQQLKQRLGEPTKPATLTASPKPPQKPTMNLLFAFVSNQLGYDTGIAISNTTLDTGTGLGATPMQGVCTLNYYCGQTGCTSPPAQTTNAPIPSGQQLTFTLSGGGGYGIAATPGFQGYIIAQCQFNYVRGFAYISAQGALPTSNGASMGYIAEIIEDRPGVMPRTIYQNRP